MERSERKAMKKQFSSLGWTLLLVLLGMNVCVYLFGMLDVVILGIQGNTAILNDNDALSNYLMQNGWGYLLTVALGLLMILLWKGREFCFRRVWKRGSPMTGGSFVMLLSIFMGGQLFFQMFSTVLESVLNQFGLSAMEEIESATMTSETISMYLYVCVAAPIWEELLFRGLILRVLEPHGKRFAIVLSALLFGMFHGNLVQVPYAFAVGLVLGYVAVEYNIGWAMVLHMINNLVLADLMYRLSTLLPSGLGNGLVNVFILICTIIGLGSLIRNWSRIRAYRHDNRMDKRKLFHFFTSAGIIVSLVVLTVLTIVPIVTS